MREVQVLKFGGEWETICEVSPIYINDVLNALKDKFSNREFRVIRK